ncbi:MAG: hypothetical protein AB7O97_08015 [Planctomycetota bacterium]
MELRDAFDQISTIRTQLAATDRLRGLRALPVALSGGLALLAAMAQALWIPDPLRAPLPWLVLWIGAATISALAAALEIARRVRESGSRLSVANAVLAVQQFTPCLVVGAIVTTFVALRLPELLWLLPGLWQLVFGLGNLAAVRLLPPPAFAVGAWYLATGALSLWLGEAALQPWVMGLPFALGQGGLAAILWWSHERPAAPPRRLSGEVRR